ncbi:MAG: hypothetical protein H6540_05490 [Bacteroidales bacterium]|nr:hypothetical protein [Bacteroidales bacterium]MCB9013568.1 hypothetical protein [Bacteroidales bacterium]
MKRFIYICGLFFFFAANAYAQPVPNVEENIPYLMTFGNKAETSWGDDDFSSTFFFLLPKNFNQPVFIRVYDPDCGGDIDELDGVWDTRTTFSVYGGKGCWSDKAAQGTDPTGNYKSGTLLATKTFGEDPRYDKGYYTFGPFNPSEGEYTERWDGNVFKIICEGVAGDDGNMYRYFLSTDPNSDKPVEGANAFAYEYSFRMHNSVEEVSHIYPFVDDQTVTVRLSNFDWDNDGFIRTVSVARRGQLSPVSGEDNWETSEFKILDAEKNTSLDIQFIKKKNPPVKNNNVVIYVKNQYGQNLEFFTSPIGGVPKYKYSIGVKPAAQ